MKVRRDRGLDRDPAQQGAAGHGQAGGNRESGRYTQRNAARFKAPGWFHIDPPGLMDESCPPPPCRR